MKPFVAILFASLSLIWSSAGIAQSLIVAGPMLGYTELRTARIWVEVSPKARLATIEYWPAAAGRSAVKKESKTVPPAHDFPTLTFTLTGLEPGTRYEYNLTAGAAPAIEKQSGSFTTQSLWNYRTPAPEFSFLAGSCNYVNEPRHDRPGEPYGKDSSIFLQMARTPADFMLWLGDNWYTREVDYASPWGLRYRAHHDRAQPVLQPLLKAVPHYAIWDDHDFGPNDFSTSYIFKDSSRAVFADYWANPSCGENGQGIYTQFMHNDVAFFLLDDRTWRSNDARHDSVSGKPDAKKRMFGKEQMEWLKDALLANRSAPFKIIATGSQVLNPASPYDCMKHFEGEFAELMEFLTEYKISGVLFLTGDRHHSEVIRYDRPGQYPLYDITASPLTSKSYEPGGAEKDIPERIPGTLVTTQNFALVRVSGGKGDRRIDVSFLDKAGIILGGWNVTEGELRVK